MSRTAPDLILGTAGHIDHGKSTLIKALTGEDPDRLSEEKERGITIELGFAELELPDGRSMGVVDVPGHERFVRQMIAGSTGIDVALLVIAADDGVMPQTIEHEAILEVLGIPRCVVALTKCDLVDAEWAQMAEEEVRTWLKTTAFADAPIVAVSGTTGQGLDALKAAIAEACKGLERTKQGTDARLPIDRVFTIKGAGTVITGTLWNGTVREGDTLEVLPQGIEARVRSIQVHGTPVDSAQAGNRVALNLAGISTDQVRPGDFLCAPGSVKATDRFDARITYLDTAHVGKPLETGVRMHVAHGTRQVLGRVLLCDGVERLGTGQSALAQIRLEEPLPVSRGDRFVLRTYSPVHMAGGGTVLLAHPRRRSMLADDEHVLLDALAAEDKQGAVEAALRLAVLPQSADNLAWQLGIPANDANRCAQAAVKAKHAVALDGATPLYATQALLQKTDAAIEKTLLGFHAEDPTAAGMSKEALHARVAPRADDAVFDALVDHALKTGRVVANGGLIGHATAQAASTAVLDQAAETVAAALTAGAMTPPDVSELSKSLGIDSGLVRKALARLEQDGAAHRLNSETFFDAKALGDAKANVAEHLAAGGDGTVAALRDVMGTSRKFAVPLLEQFDASGFTLRDGDQRRLK